MLTAVRDGECSVTAKKIMHHTADEMCAPELNKRVSAPPTQTTRYVVINKKNAAHGVASRYRGGREIFANIRNKSGGIIKSSGANRNYLSSTGTILVHMGFRLSRPTGQNTYQVPIIRKVRV